MLIESQYLFILWNYITISCITSLLNCPLPWVVVLIRRREIGTRVLLCLTFRFPFEQKMYSERSVVAHVLFFVVCATAVVCLKKDQYFCELSSSCTCMTANDNNNIDLGGVNLTLTIADNQTLNYQPCVSEIVVSDEHIVDGIGFTSNSNVIYKTRVDHFLTSWTFWSRRRANVFRHCSLVVTHTHRVWTLLIFSLIDSEKY